MPTHHCPSLPYPQPAGVAGRAHALGPTLGQKIPIATIVTCHAPRMTCEPSDKKRHVTPCLLFSHACTLLPRICTQRGEMGARGKKRALTTQHRTHMPPTSLPRPHAAYSSNILARERLNPTKNRHTAAILSHFPFHTQGNIARTDTSEPRRTIHATRTPYTRRSRRSPASSGDRTPIPPPASCFTLRKKRLFADHTNNKNDKKQGARWNRRSQR